MDGFSWRCLPSIVLQRRKSLYARDDAHKEHLIKSQFKGKGKIDVSRFKGLGEMPPAQLRETTMNPATRTLLRSLCGTSQTEEDQHAARATECLVEQLMGRKPEARFNFIQTHAQFAEGLDI